MEQRYGVPQVLFSIPFYAALVFGGEALANMTSSPATVGIMIGGLGVMAREVILDVFGV